MNVAVGGSHTLAILQLLHPFDEAGWLAFDIIFTFVNISLDASTTVEHTRRVMAKKPVELTEAEWRIIKAVWDEEPCSAPAVQEKLHRRTAWTYSTVRTLMDRMVGKGLLLAEKVGHGTLFRSAVTREQAQRGELLYALKHAFNGALTPMLQCLLDTGELSSSELAQLEELIKAKKRSALQGSAGRNS